MWESILKVIGLVFLDIGMLAALFMIPLGLPGNFLLLGLAILAAWLGGFQSISILSLGIILLVVLLAEVAEAMLSSLMARKSGASWWGVAGAMAGGLAGAILGSMILPLFGTLVGAFLGSAVGATGLEAWKRGRADSEALRAGWGAFLGRVLSSVLKISVGMGIAVWVIYCTH
ncbi:MAG: DUF456 domain-containing protein [Candidatus Krumholzibacteria bacterium]|jgi:hypothetical protein|nr:DUF456 domain-containing protein [Candidatus Krumholzibacteria bacterium]MDP6670145.1 DUF456 domain-containing protein [Candidatus Krumholzibacteria bacterium]MDP7022264.1 DUF456 domain-containing protein [Candidatus Krumholzibacteria bacterium]